MLAVHRLTANPEGGSGVAVAFDAIGGSHFKRSFACLAPGGMLIGYGSQTMATGGEELAVAGLGLARLKLWGALGGMFGGRSAVFYSMNVRRAKYPDEFISGMKALFELLRNGAIHPVGTDRLLLSEARAVHVRIDSGED